MSEYIVDGAEPNSTVLKSTTSNGYEHEKWLPVREEIVRCRDCEHYMDYEHEYEPNLGYCRFHDMEEVRDSQFCAWAERRQP